MVPPVMNDKIMSLPKGWVVVYKDNTVVVEGDIEWNQVVKREIASLSLKWLDKFWTVAGKDSYLCFKRGYVTFSPTGNYCNDSTLYERCIGYYDEKGRKVIYKVNEQTGVMKMEVREG